MRRWNASHCLLDAFIISMNHKAAVKPNHICTSNSLCLHTDGLFFSLCSPPLVLLLLNLSRCVYRRWITLHFHSEIHWIKKKMILKKKHTTPVCGEVLWPTLPLPWTSLSGSHVQISVRFTHCLRLSSGPWGICSAGWPAVGVRASGCVFFSFFFFLCWIGRWEHRVAAGEACRNTTRYWLNNLCHLIVMWLTPASCCVLHSSYHSLR